MLLQNRYDGLWAKLYAVEEPARTKETAWLIQRAQMEGSPVCELACGAGRLAIPMAEHGIEIVGMDLSATLIQHANERLKSLPARVAQRARFIQGDLRRFNIGKRFPFIFIFFGGFEHLTERTDQSNSLECIREHLEPGGLLEIEFMSPSGPQEYFEEPRVTCEETKKVEWLRAQVRTRESLWWVDAKRYCDKTENMGDCSTDTEIFGES